MRTSYFPSTDSGLLAFAANLAARISAAPQDYGISPQQAQQLAAKQQALAAAQAKASEPATRTRPNIADRNDAREAFKAEARRIVSIIKGQPDVTDAQRLALGLKARSTTRTRVPPPDAAPLVRIKNVSLSAVRLQLADAATGRAAKPRGVSGATLFSFVGDEPPSSISAWKYTGLTGSVNCTVRFNGNPPPGTKVWIAAFWFSFRNERGPTSAPVSTHLCGLPALAKAA